MTRRVNNQFGRAFKCCYEVSEIIFSLSCDCMKEGVCDVHVEGVKDADLRHFDRGKNLVARRLITIKYETVCIMGCSGYIVASTCTKKMNDCEIFSDEAIALNAKTL